MTSHRGHQPPSSSHITARRSTAKDTKDGWLLQVIIARDGRFFREKGDCWYRRVICASTKILLLLWETFNTIKKPRATCPLYVRTRCPAPATPAPGPGGPWPLGWATRAAASLLSIFDISLPSIVTAAPPHQGTSQGGPRTCKQSLYCVYVPINCRQRCLKWKSV